MIRWMAHDNTRYVMRNTQYAGYIIHVTWYEIHNTLTLFSQPHSRTWTLSLSLPHQPTFVRKAVALCASNLPDQKTHELTSRVGVIHAEVVMCETSVESRVLTRAESWVRDGVWNECIHIYVGICVRAFLLSLSARNIRSLRRQVVVTGLRQFLTTQTARILDSWMSPLQPTYSYNPHGCMS